MALAVVARQSGTGNRKSENSVAFRHRLSGLNGSLTAPCRTRTPRPEMTLYVHILIHLLYSTF